MNVDRSEDDDRQIKEKIWRLYEKYKGLMGYVTYDILRNNEDTEDVVHEAFLYLIQNPDQAMKLNEEDCKAYMVILAKSRAIDCLRRKALLQTTEYNDELKSSDLVVEIEDGVLKKALEQLPDRYREIIVLRAQGGYTLSEIAEILKINYETVKKNHARAKRKLKKLLEKEGVHL